MREGVGLSAALGWSVQRFAQRAIEDLLTYDQTREFVIDAGIATEFAAKAVVCRKDPAWLFQVSDQPVLTALQLAIVDPGPLRKRPSPDQWGVELRKLVQLQTVAATDAVSAAAERCAVDSAAAKRVLAARNQAAHLGDVDRDTIDATARDFLRVVERLWLCLDRSRSDLWGDLEPIASTRHLRIARGRKADVDVRVTLARRRWHSDLFAAHRRGAFRVNGVQHTSCPACRSCATLTRRPASSVGNPNVAEDDGQLLPVLECLCCGLMVAGSREIRWARALQLAPSAPYDPPS